MSCSSTEQANSGMRNRNRIEIIGDILKAANGGNATRSKLTYKTFLSYAQMKEYPSVLTEKDLIRYDEDTQTFKTTEKGLSFLDTYNLIGDMIKEQRQRQSRL
jgi:predicted transcriptional regulator